MEISLLTPSISGNPEEIVSSFLRHIGEDPEREGLVDTPKRVVRMWNDIFGGYKDDVKQYFKAVFESENDQMVIIDPIYYYSTCEHHVVPFFGNVHIGYIPDKKVLGLSKFVRVIDVFAKRLQIQEQLTCQIANSIQENLKPLGVGVIVTGTHLCMCQRGVKRQGTVTTTSAMLGNFRTQTETRKEFLSLIAPR